VNPYHPASAAYWYKEQRTITAGERQRNKPDAALRAARIAMRNVRARALRSLGINPLPSPAAVARAAAQAAAQAAAAQAAAAAAKAAVAAAVAAAAADGQTRLETLIGRRGGAGALVLERVGGARQLGAFGLVSKWCVLHT
jgi:hypothetical protein